MPRYSFLCFYPELPECVGFCLALIWGHSNSLLFQIFLFFFLFLLVFPLEICYTFCSYLRVFGYSVLFPQSLFSFFLIFKGLYWDILKNSLFSAVSRVLMTPSKMFFITITVFLISSIFLEVSCFCLHYHLLLNADFIHWFP